MSAAQPGILTPIPVVGRYLFFSISQPEQVAATLASLAAATDGYQLVVGIGHSLMLSLGKTVEGMKDYPVLAAPGIDLPSTPSALWCWLRGEDRGEVTLRSHALERSLAPAFQRTGAVDAFLYGEDRDLSGYKDGTENPKGDAALEAALVSGRGAGLDGGSFVAVQQWLHDFDRMQAIPGEEMDNIIGRRKSDDEELEDAPAYAHVKRTEQESFEPAAFLLRRGAPWSDEHRAGCCSPPSAARSRPSSPVATDDRRGRRGARWPVPFHPADQRQLLLVSAHGRRPPRPVRPRPLSPPRQQARPAAASCAALVGGGHGGLVDQRRYFLRSRGQ